jgi:hypothetical protein
VPPRGIAVTVEAEARAPAERAFDAIAPIALERMFERFGPLPGVNGTRDQTGAWDHVGATRVVELSDGSEAHERISAYSPPQHFAYRVSGFTGALRLLVEHADGAWWFSDRDGGSTHVRWTYVFQPRAGRRWLARVAVAPLWRPYARRALARAVSIAEERWTASQTAAATAAAPPRAPSHSRP